MDSAKSELAKCEKAGMTQEDLAESQKPVYSTVTDSRYCDISSGADLSTEVSDHVILIRTLVKLPNRMRRARLRSYH